MNWKDVQRDPDVDWVADHMLIDNTGRPNVLPVRGLQVLAILKKHFGSIVSIPDGTEFHVVVTKLSTVYVSEDGSQGDMLMLVVRKPDWKGLDFVSRFYRSAKQGPSHRAMYTINLLETEEMWGCAPLGIKKVGKSE